MVNLFLSKPQWDFQKFMRTKIVNNKSINIVGSEFILECDMLIMATGQEKNTNFFDMIGNLEVDTLKRVVVNPETYQTKNKKYFAGGDAINGGAEVVNAAFDGKMAALGIHKYLAK
jgi:glutamate synthase (NADPH/NADH) small chain